ncbi:unnamed protein product, partial [Laminaria digitata]
ASLLLLFAGLSGCRNNAGDEPEARVHVIESATELLWGPAATGAIGDFMLTNGHVMAVI